MLGISWYELIIVILVSFVFLKPKEIFKLIISVRDIFRFINSFITDLYTKVEKDITLTNSAFDEFYVVDEKEDNQQKGKER